MLMNTTLVASYQAMQIGLNFWTLTMDATTFTSWLFTLQRKLLLNIRFPVCVVETP